MTDWVNGIDMTVRTVLKLLPMTFIRQNSSARWLKRDTGAVTFFPAFKMFSVGLIAVQTKLSSAKIYLLSGSGPETELAIFSDSSSDSDTGQNGRLRQALTPVSTPAPQLCLAPSMAPARRQKALMCCGKGP